MSKMIRSHYSDLNLVTGKNISEYIWSTLHKWPTAHCLVCGITGKIYSYEETSRLSKIFSKNLSLSKFRKGEIVSTILVNSPELIISTLGIWEAGGTVQPMNPILTQREIQELLDHSEATCIITDKPSVANFLRSSPKYNGKVIIFVETETELQGINEYIKFSSMLREPDCSIEEIGNKLSLDKASDNDVAFLLYSSGTTGKPKGIQRTHFSIINDVLAGVQPQTCNLRPFENDNVQEVYIALLPLSHIFGIYALILAMTFGSKIIILPKFTPETYVAAIEVYRPSFYYLVPYLIDFMANNCDLKKEYLANTKMIVYGAAPMSQTILQNFLNKFGDHIFLNQGYGMTETGASFLSNPEIKKRGSIGCLVANNIAKVVNPDTGKCLGPNQPGELYIKGPFMTSGYFKDKAATDSLLDSDGFVRTGDLVRYDEDEWFYILDRLKDIIKVKGYLVSPSEIENELLKLEDVLDVAVVGVNLANTEAPRAFIVTNTNLEKNIIHKYLEGKVAPLIKDLLGCRICEGDTTFPQWENIKEAFP